MNRDYEDDTPAEDPFDDPEFANSVDELIATDFGSLDDLSSDSQDEEEEVEVSGDPGAPGVFPPDYTQPYPPALDGPAKEPGGGYTPTGLV